MALAEALESRLQLSNVNENLGTLDGRVYRQNNLGHGTSDEYRFHLPRAGEIQLQLSRMIGKARIVLEQGTDFPGIFINNTPFSSADHELKASVPAGDYFMFVQPSADTGIIPAFYTLAISADYALGALVSGSNSVIRADLGRNLGTLSAASTLTVQDFLGFLDTSGHSARDPIDTYFFDVPIASSLQVHEEGATTDVANNSAVVSGAVGIYRNFDNDGQLEPNELIDSGHFDTRTNTQTSAFASLSPGKYAVVVDNLSNPDDDSAGGTNYKLQFFYTVPDAAGSTLASAKDLGTIGLNASPVVDYLSSVDTTDIFKFKTATGLGGPFVFDGALNGFSHGDFDIDLLDSSGAVIKSSATRGTVAEHLARSGLGPGTYFVRIKRFSGEDKYSLTLSMNNTDAAGNTLATAKNIGELLGARELADAVSATDTSALPP